jgi:uncharacterized membrane protein
MLMDIVGAIFIIGIITIALLLAIGFNCIYRILNRFKYGYSDSSFNSKRRRNRRRYY